MEAPGIVDQPTLIQKHIMIGRLANASIKTIQALDDIAELDNQVRMVTKDLNDLTKKRQKIVEVHTACQNEEVDISTKLEELNKKIAQEEPLDIQSLGPKYGNNNIVEKYRISRGLKKRSRFYSP
jgi:regulator of replication initiation timing